MNPEEKQEFALSTMLKDFYNRKMLSVIILTWFWFLVALAVGIFCGVEYYHASEPKELIFYAVIFLICVQTVALLKLFGYGFIHRNAINRRLDRLEQRIAELYEKISK
jgi:uncharacterized membrane protein YoaK (UPF0700 family)